MSQYAAVTAWSAPLPGISANANGNISVTGTIAENATAGTPLFTATATVDSGKASYALTTDADGKGTINSTTGVVTLATGQSIDFETTPTLLFVIKATESGGGTGTATITLTITDVNEAPAFSSATTTVCLNDNSTAGTILGTYNATDPDKGNTITYSIVSGNTNTDFSLNTSTGVIAVASGHTLSKARTPTYPLVVNAIDSAGTPLTGTTTITVTIGDCRGISGGTAIIADSKKAPAFSSNSSTVCINDKSAAGTTLGTYTATHPDAGNTLTYSIASTGNTNSDFAVVKSTGVITVAPGKQLSNARTATYALVINAIDNAVPPQTGTTTISVTVGECSGTVALMSFISLMIVALFATLFV